MGAQIIKNKFTRTSAINKLSLNNITMN